MTRSADVQTASVSWRAKALAWAAHVYTALGLVAAAGIAVLIVRGDPESLRWAFVLMLASTLIDATDGTFARRVRVREVLPDFDGRRLDDIIDFMTFTALPLLLVWRAEILPAVLSWWLVVPLVASAYGFCQASIKTDDGYFLGFPSYWNVVAFYLYVLRPPAWGTLALVLFLAFLTFVPSRYLYPSQPGRLNRVTGVIGLAWVSLPLWVLFHLPVDATAATRGGATDWLAVASLAYPAYYMVCSWVVTIRFWRRHRASEGSFKL